MNLRPPTEDDIREITALYNAVPQALYGADVATERVLRTWFRSPATDIERNLRVAVDDGAVLGYADIDPRGSEPTRCWAEAAIRRAEDFEPTATALFDWLEARACEETDPVIRANVWQKDDPMKRLLEERGYALIRHSYTMEIELGDTVAKPTWPDGITVRTFRDGDGYEIWVVHEDTFADTWEYPGVPFDEWKHWMLQGPMFDPELWFLAVDGDDLPGICLCRVSDREPGLGWVQILGVRREWRRRGLGRALLQHAFSAFHGRGFRRVGLGVDAASLTGAERLYESAGMHAVRQRDFYEKRV
jgi:mycothiol synthase